MNDLELVNSCWDLPAERIEADELTQSVCDPHLLSEIQDSHWNSIYMYNILPVTIPDYSLSVKCQVINIQIRMYIF